VTLVSVAGLGLVLVARPAPMQTWRIAEWVLLFGIGGLWRAVLFGAPPTFSPDAYRYLWDAHLLLHGLSPYLHGPDYPGFAGLRDAVIWPILGFRNVPTIYPPGALLVFVVAGSVAPLKIGALKFAIALADWASAILLIALLRRQGSDPRRFILYWWSPLPIIEFALNAHIDAVAIAWALAALLVAGIATRGARVAAGIFLAMAALTKIYPLLFVIAIARREDRGFFAALGGTLVLAYLPFIPLGLGGGGFLGTYFRQRWVDQGILQRFLGQIVTGAGGSASLLTLLQLGCIGALCLGVAWWRWRVGLSPAASILALSAIWMLFAPHLFPWYLPAILPFVALAWDGQVPQMAAATPLQRTPTAPVLALWLFALLMPFTYVIFAPGGTAELFQVFFYLPFVLALSPLRHAAQRATLRQQWRVATAPGATIPAAFAKRGVR
ncbi:MAG: DUF2029 domain-containing protein, partial [Ktedonobacterales bacterium]|nr:DUF2029 domain-containing protein [Ktedonobacterales bacterium]